MAAFTLAKTHPFADGATVYAYEDRGQVVNGNPPPSAVIDSAVVAAGGGVTFDALVEGVRYWAYGQVNGAWRRVGFYVARTPELPAEGERVLGRDLQELTGGELGSIATDAELAAVNAALGLRLDNLEADAIRKDPAAAQTTSRSFVVDVPEDDVDTETNGFRVFTTNPLSGRALRFAVENNQDTDEVDINLRNATVNVGNPDAGLSVAGAQLIFMGPTGDTSNPILVKKPGDGPNGVTAFYVDRNGGIHSRAWGLATTHFDIRADGEANARFQLVESGSNVLMGFGAGGATAVDATFGRSAAGVLKAFQALHVAGDFKHLGFGSTLAFFNSAGQGKGTVTGSRGGNAALASLLTALAGYGLITDSSTA